MKRSVARARAMQMVYEWELGGDGGEDTKLGLLEIKPDESEADYVDSLVAGVTENKADIDAKIEKYAIGWTLERISRVDLSILRVAVYEMLLHPCPRVLPSARRSNLQTPIPPTKRERLSTAFSEAS